MPNKVVIQIDGKNKGAITAINGVKPPLNSLGRSVDNLKTKMSTSFGGIQNVIGGLQRKIALLGTAAVAAFGLMIKNAIDTAESLEKMSQRVGLSVEFLSTLRHAAELSGTEIGVMEKALQRMSRTMFDANRGLLTAKIPFDQLGIAVSDSMGRLRNGEEIIYEVADAFGRMKDGTEKTALALQIFGRAGADLIPMLNEGAAGLKTMQEEARGLGLEISTNTAKNAAQFKDNMLRLERAVTGVANVMAEQLLDPLVKISDAMVNATGETEKLSSAMEVVGGTLKVVASGATIAATNIMAIWTITASFIKANVELVQGNVDGFLKALEDNDKKIAGLYSGGFEFLKTLWSDTENQLKSLGTNADAMFWFIENGTDKVIDETENLNKQYRDLAINIDEITARNLQSDVPQFAKEPPVDLERMQEVYQMQMDMSTEVTDLELTNLALRQQGTVQMFDNMAGAAMMFYTASGNASKQWFGVYKAFAITTTAIATYQAAVEAYKSMVGIPVVGPGLAVAAAAAATAFGLGNIARIASMQPGGGFGGVPSTPSLPSGGITNNNTTNVNNQNREVTVIFNYEGPNDFDEMARKIIPAIEKAYGDGAGG